MSNLRELGNFPKLTFFDILGLRNPQTFSNPTLPRGLKIAPKDPPKIALGTKNLTLQNKLLNFAHTSIFWASFTFPSVSAGLAD